MTTATMERPTHATTDADEHRYEVRNPREILATMREIQRTQPMVMVTIVGAHPMISALMDVAPEDGRLVFDAPEMHAPGENPMPVHVELRLNGVRVRFESIAVPGAHQGYPALFVRIPEIIVRWQRRDAFRIDAPVAEPIYCRFYINNGMRELLLRIANLSAKGMSLLGGQGEWDAKPGTRVEGARIDLPGTAVIPCAFEVVHEQYRETPAGRRRVLGCHFIEMPGPLQTVLSRYLTELERSRLAKR